MSERATRVPGFLGSACPVAAMEAVVARLGAQERREARPFMGMASQFPLHRTSDLHLSIEPRAAGWRRRRVP